MNAIPRQKKANSGQAVDPTAVFDRVLREGPDALLTLAEAVALLAVRDMRSHDSKRGAENRVRTRLRRSQKKSSDVDMGGLAVQPDGRYTVHEVQRWAIFNLKGAQKRFLDLPRKPRKVRDFCEARAEADSAVIAADVLPGTLSACHTLIRSLWAEIATSKALAIRAKEEHEHELARRFERYRTE